MISLFFAFFKIGCVSVGGGYAMLPVIYQTVAKFGIMSKHEFSNLIAISQITPGPIAVNAATYTGFEAFGLAGALLISTAVCLPCALFSYAAVRILKKHESTIAMDKIMHEMKIAGIALVAVSGFFLAEGSLYSGQMFPVPEGLQIDPLQIGLCLLTFLLYYKTKMSPVMLTLLMGVLSILGERIIVVVNHIL